jgi:hypothetical protein
MAQNSVSITKIIETNCSSPFVKTVELYVEGTVDFSTEIQMNYMANGGNWSSNDIDITGFGVITDTFIYMVRDVLLMRDEFPSTTFETNPALPEFNTLITTTATNGNDGYQVVYNGNVVSQFGKTNTDADDDPIWEHDDSVVARKADVSDNGLWDETHWDYTGKNSLDFETNCEGGLGIEAFLANLGRSYPLGSSTVAPAGPGLTLNPNTTGSFLFNPAAPVVRPPIEVFYHIPAGDITTMPILMSFHGSDRDADNHRDFWINMANANGFIVISPEFSNSNYGGLGDNYLLANIFEDGDNPSTATFNDRNQWTISTLDPLFDYITAAISSTQTEYSAWGHSGGAQILHRFVTYLPNSKLKTAVCSNAGWYTVPENTISFPYGILNGQLPAADLTAAFSKKLIVHLGQNDNDPNSGLRSNTVVDSQQGIHRLERGRYYFNTSQTTAQSMAATFNWEKREISGVGHDPQLMANDALQYILTSFLSSEAIISDLSIRLYPNPSSLGYVTISNTSNNFMDVIVHDGLGKQLISHAMETDQLDITGLKKGIYFVKIITNGGTTLIKKLIIN